MLNSFLHKFRLAISDKALRARILFLFAALVVFRALSAIPITGIDKVRLEQFFSNNQFIGLLNIFSGAGFSQLSIMMLGVGPYITASIIMQLATVVFPQVKAMYSEEGEAGRARFVSFSRMLTVPLAVLQGVAFMTLLERQSILIAPTPLLFATDVMLVAGGSMLLMWIGELITEFGIGNGVSLIIFAGIVARIPGGISQALFAASSANIPAYVGFAVIAILAIFFVTLVSEAERSIPIAYARQVRGGAMAGGAATYLPIRLLQAGVIPIIFALSLLLLPQMAITALSALGVKNLASASAAYTAFSANPFAYGAVYFVLVIIFTYLYTSITFEPHRVADNLQKSGAFVPGVRPGTETEKYIGNVVNRVTLPGALFLATIAVVPFIVQGITGISSVLVGGTALLIAVTVLLDLIRKIDAQISLREY
jgi:preprotein translocase subunit SecY